MMRQLSLRTRTMLLASFAVGAILFCDAALRIRAERQTGHTDLSNRAAVLAAMQADALSVPMWNFDDELLGAALEALSRDPDFARAEILNPDGQVLRARNRPEPLDGVAAPTIQSSRPILYLDHGHGRLLGQFRLSLRTDRLEATLTREFWQRALPMLLVLSAVLVILGVSIRQLSRPLDLLADALTRLALGDQEVEIPARHRTDEIGAVARGLQVFKDTAFQLARTQNEYRAVFDHAALGIYCLDPEGELVSVNPCLLALTGYPDVVAMRSSLHATDGKALFVDPDRLAQLYGLLASKGGYDGELSEIRCVDGNTLWVTKTARPVSDPSGRLLGYVATAEDITERRRQAAEERLRIRAAMESAGDAMLIADADGAPLFVNRAFSTILGYDLAGLAGVGGMSHLLRDGATGRQLAQAMKGASCRIEADMLARSGRIIPMAVNVGAISDENGQAVGSVAICTDLSHQREAAAQIAHMAHHDPLTGLPNRSEFGRQLAAAVESSRAHGELLAVTCLNLERFKEVNDTLGHASGDELLRSVAARLSDALTEGDIVARVGGDEFALIHQQDRSAEHAESWAASILDALARPYRIGETELVVGARVGIAVCPDDCADPEGLLRLADLALYSAKSAERNAIRRFSPDMDRVLQIRSSMERDLRGAIGGPCLEVHYQPQCKLLTGTIIGAEALLRWTHPERGPVSPAEFIPIAEQTGLIGPLGEWVLRTACRTAASWPQPIRIAVNISPAQFRTGDLLSQVRSALAETGLPPSRLELEITEGVMLSETDATLAALHALKALGVRLSMDDFGTGYSSLSYLRRMPIDKIKIDQSFVRALGIEPAAGALVRSIIGIGRGLGIEANAEGVETEDQAAFLRQEGCHEVQGWLYGRPQPAQVFSALLTNVQSRAA